MKRYFIITAFALGLACSCDEKSEPTVDPSTFTLTPATATAPDDAITIDLDDFDSTLDFSWTEGSWDGTGWPVYDIAFDTADGDFSSPIAVYHGGNIGVTSLSLGKTELKEMFNTVAAGEKIKTTEIKWLVRTSAPGRRISAASTRKITLNMTPDPDAFVAGNEVFIDGEGAKEAGRKMVYIPSTTYSWDKAVSAHYNDNSPRCKEFDYEIFTELEAGKPVYMWSGNSTGDKDWYFTFAAGDVVSSTSYNMSIAKEADLSASVLQSGVYRIRINTATKEVYAKRISNARFRYWQGGAKDNNMTYQGDGVWSIDLNIPAAALGYKILLVGLDGDQPHGAQYPAEATPTGDVGSWNPADKYWNIVSVQGGAADGKKANGTFLVPDSAKGQKVRYTLYMNDTYGTYTHCISKAE